MRLLTLIGFIYSYLFVFADEQVLDNSNLQNNYKMTALKSHNKKLEHRLNQLERDWYLETKIRDGLYFSPQEYLYEFTINKTLFDDPYLKMWKDLGWEYTTNIYKESITEYIEPKYGWLFNN